MIVPPTTAIATMSKVAITGATALLLVRRSFCASFVVIITRLYNRDFLKTDAVHLTEQKPSTKMKYSNTNHTNS